MKQHPWCRSPKAVFILPPAARRARETYLAEWRDRIKFTRRAGVTSFDAINELTLADEAGVEQAITPV